MTSTPERPELTVGTVVGHANPELADWAGTITQNRAGNWSRRRWADLPEVWVTWTAGTAGDGGPLADCKPGWFPVDALTVKGQCPDCARSAHYVMDGRDWDRVPGWAHEGAAPRADVLGRQGHVRGRPPRASERLTTDRRPGSCR